jgi:hypothetical protein
MASKARFLKAADNTRPYKSHRYDVFGLKIERQLTLFGQAPLKTWVALEAEPSVVAYCERPLVVPDVSPRRVVDFWVRFGDREELWLLEREKDRNGGSDPKQLMPALTGWGTTNGVSVRFVPPVRHEKDVYLDNWGRIIRELSANRRFVSRGLCEEVRARLELPISLACLTALFPAEDPVLVRTAAFALMHSGRARCSDIHAQRIGPASTLEGL